jgi:hypothetical protein
VDLLVDHLVGLTEQVAPLAVPAHDELHVQLGQEQRRDLAGERTRVLPVAVLGPEEDVEIVASITVWTLRMSVNGGCTLTSTRSYTSFGTE